MTVCGSGFFITSFPPVSRNLSTIWKAHWVLVWLVVFLQDDVLWRKEQKAESQGCECLFIAASWIVPQGGRTHSPFVHLAPPWGTSWFPIPSGSSACAGSVGCRGVPGLSLCITPQLLAPLLEETQLGCVPWRATELCSADVAMGCPSPHSYLCCSLSTQRGLQRWSVYKSLLINLLRHSASLLLLIMTVQEGIGIAFPGSTWLWLGAKPRELLMQ